MPNVFWDRSLSPMCVCSSLYNHRLSVGTVLSLAQTLLQAYSVIRSSSLPGKLLICTHCARTLACYCQRKSTCIFVHYSMFFKSARAVLPTLFWEVYHSQSAYLRGCSHLHCRQRVEPVYQLIMSAAQSLDLCQQDPKAAGPRQQTESANVWLDLLHVALADASKSCTWVVTTALPLQQPLITFTVLQNQLASMLRSFLLLSHL